MFKHCLYMKQIEITKNVQKWGNSAGILLPREYVGKEAKIVLIDRSLEIKKETLKILEPYLDEIIGVYLVGSYARGEQTKDSDIDIFAISKKIKKTFNSGIYEIEIIPIEDVIKLLEKFPAAIYPKFTDAKSIINKALLEEIKEIKITKKSMKPYIENCKEIIKTHKKFIKDDKKIGLVLKSYSIIYSAILRLKALYIMKSILNNKKHTNKAFNKYLIRNLKINEKQLQDLYSIYRAVARDKKVKAKINISLGESLINLLEEEVKKW